MNSRTKYVSAIAVLAVAVISIFMIAGDPVAAADHMVGDDPKDFANVSWILICSILVFVMTPGVALFYGGMLRKQSMSSIIAQTLIAIGVMTVSWIIVGYSLAFSSGNMFFGNLDKVFLNGVSADIILDGSSIPEMEFMLFQMMFGLITAGIVLGACAERIKYTAITWFLAVWSILVYAPMAHMVWGGGFLAEGLPFDLTTLDFAGGTVVHICAGTTGLALIAYLGKRSDRTVKRSHSIPMTFIGCLLLWMGWFGFNGGSGLNADGQAINAVVVSQISAACAMLGWAAIQYIHVGRVGGLGLIAGAIAGLVAITPAAGYVTPVDSIIIGFVGGAICYFGVIFMRQKSGLDDALDVMGVHGIGGIWGAIATGLFASESYGGLIYSGDWHLFVGQLFAIAFTLVFCFVMSYAIIYVIGRIIKGARISEDEEAIGQDIIEHGEPAYYM